MVSIYFLEVSYSPKPPIQAPFYVGPYKTEEDAKKRSKSLDASPLPVLQLVKVKKMSGEEIGTNKILVEGNRSFSLELFPEVAETGEIDNNQKEHFFPSDYFESSTEFV